MGPMAGTEQIRALMQELGQVLDFAEVAERAETRTWSLTTRDGAILFVELAADGERLWLSAEAGVPRPSDRERLYPLMLQYNAQWQQTGGVRLALDGPEGAAVLAYDMPVTGLGVPPLCTVIANYLVMLGGWRRIVAGAAAGGPPEPVADVTMEHAAASGIIRG